MPIQKITSGIIQDGAIEAADIVSIANTQITGNIVSSQITSVANTQITGNIVSSQITSVANTQITGNITATNIAGGSNGTIPYQSASGTTQMLAVGSSGQLLQTNGAGAPSWVTASSGALTLLSTVTASTSSTVDIETTFNSTYDAYMIIASGVTVSDTGAFYMRLKINGTYATGSSYHYNVQENVATETIFNSAAETTGTAIKLASYITNGSNDFSHFVVRVYRPADTTHRKYITYEGVQGTSAGSRGILGIGGWTGGNEALTGVRFFRQIGTINTGTFRLYGIAN